MWLARARASRALVFEGVALVGVLSLGASFAPIAEAAPPNDRFRDAIELRDGQTVRGTLDRARAQGGEMRYFRPASHAVWYRFRAPRTGLIGVKACIEVQMAVGVFRGRSLSALRRLRFSDGGGGPDCSARAIGIEIKLRARRGVTYSIAVAGSTARGAFRLRVFSIRPPPNDDFADAVPLTLGSSRAGTTVGSTRELAEPARCCGVLHTVWYRLRVASATQVRLYACGQSSPMIAIYTGRRVDRLTRVGYFRFCVVQFAAKPGVTYRVAVDDRGWWGNFKLLAGAVTPPPNDDFAEATAITLGTTLTGTTAYATREPGEPDTPALFTVWFELNVETPGVIEVRAPCNANGSSRFDVYTGEEVSQLQAVAMRPVPDQPAPCPFQFDASPGAYHLRAGAHLFDEGRFEFSARTVP